MKLIKGCFYRFGTMQPAEKQNTWECSLNASHTLTHGTKPKENKCVKWTAFGSVDYKPVPEWLKAELGAKI